MNWLSWRLVSLISSFRDDDQTDHLAGRSNEFPKRFMPFENSTKTHQHFSMISFPQNGESPTQAAIQQFMSNTQSIQASTQRKRFQKQKLAWRQRRYRNWQIKWLKAPQTTACPFKFTVNETNYKTKTKKKFFPSRIAQVNCQLEERPKHECINETTGHSFMIRVGIVNATKLWHSAIGGDDEQQQFDLNGICIAMHSHNHS